MPGDLCLIGSPRGYDDGKVSTPIYATAGERLRMGPNVRVTLQIALAVLFVIIAIAMVLKTVK